jgi:hypothetical protein
VTPAPIRGLSLTPIRTPGSRELDGQRVKPRGASAATIPPYRSWHDSMRYLAEHWRPGQHMALVARTRSGKTTAARRMLALRDYVVVFGTKPRDPDVYDALVEQGYVIRETWDPTDLSENRVILKPPLEDATPEAMLKQRAVFQRALLGLFRTGGWTLYLDEAKYVAVDLKLARELDILWLQGAAMGITIVAATQRPRSVPLNMFEQSSWFGIWRVNDRDDRLRASEMLGPLAGVAFETTGVLPRFEFLLVDVNEDHAMRTKVDA